MEFLYLSHMSFISSDYINNSSGRFFVWETCKEEMLTPSIHVSSAGNVLCRVNALRSNVITRTAKEALATILLIVVVGCLLTS